MAAKTCAVDGCSAPFHAAAWCANHYWRWKTYGDPTFDTGRRKNVGPCSVDGCENPSRRRGWCSSHYTQWYRGDEVAPITRAWTPKGSPCLVCGGKTGVIAGFRKYCGPNCSALARAYGGEVPASVKCSLCGCSVDLTAGKTPSGKRLRSDTKLCVDCRATRRPRRHYSAHALADRDGADCGICGGPIDMSLRAPDVMSPSIDHITPRALGGSDDPSNLQLAHLSCNCSRQARALDDVRRAG